MVAEPARLSPAGSLVRRADPDRFLTALFAPAAKREALFTLYAFNVETARARDVTTQPMMALIRLQWWREVVEGARKSHEIATPLSALLEAGALDPADLLAVLDAREITEFATMQEWQDWLLAGPGSLAVAAGRLLGGAPDRLRQLGAGYAAAGVLRSLLPLARTGQCLLPADLLDAHGLSTHAVLAKPLDPAVHPAVAALALHAKEWLGAPARLGPAFAAGLPAVLARRDLRKLAANLIQPAPRGLGDRLAVTAAALLGQA